MGPPSHIIIKATDRILSGSEFQGVPLGHPEFPQGFRRVSGHSLYPPLLGVPLPPPFNATLSTIHDTVESSR